MSIRRLSAATLFSALFAFSPRSALSQNQAPSPGGKDTVVVRAGAIYEAGSLHRKLLGDNYRDIWTAPIKVPVLDLRTFAGGLRPLKAGGGKQTKSLRFVTRDSTEYVFRPVLKSGLVLSDQYRGTVIWSSVRDQGSASHPLGAFAGDSILGTVGVLHPHPFLVVMPDDSTLGEFRKEYAGELGMLEEYPSVPRDARGFAGALHIIDSDTLLARMNGNPLNQVDQRTFLTARLVDMILGDNDRHPAQWKWARLEKGDDAPWEPISRDRDKDFVSYEGTVLRIARIAVPSLITFGPAYPDPAALFANAMEFDRRALQSLDRSVWDSVATGLTRSLTDAVIDNAVQTMPPEYAASSRQIAQKLKIRREHLPAIADRYYRTLWSVADIHATDADDRATVVRSGDGIVDVSIESGSKTPWLRRRFDARDTHEIRLYLHDGNDTAVVTGNAQRSIPVRIIGGNGNNAIADASIVGGDRNPTRLYDAGSVNDVKYGRDTVDENENEDDAFNHYFNRRPWVKAYGTLIPPVRDRGAALRPVIGFHTSRGLGAIIKLGAAHYSYGFRRVPYASMVKGEIAYATANRFEAGLSTDNRFESSNVHIPVDAKMTQLEVVQFHGFGNDVPDLRGRFYDLKQTQWIFNPGIGFALGPESDLSLGPIVRYTKTDSLSNRFISAQHPYGFPIFGEAGLQLKLHYDSKVRPDTVRPRTVIDLTGAGYPSIWDVASAYEVIAGSATTFITLPAKNRPVLALRAGGRKLFGDFPYFDAAFLGGSSSLRIENRQRFAGDASIYGTTELRVPVAKFPLVLPLDVGLLGFADAGRVYVNGDSPGGWHSAAGGGFWVGFVNPGINLNVLFTNQSRHRTLVSIGFAL